MGFLSSRSSSDVQPCEVILGGMLSPAATIRDSKRTHFASLSYRLPRTPGHYVTLLPWLSFLTLLSIPVSFRHAAQCVLRPPCHPKCVNLLVYRLLSSHSA